MKRILSTSVILFCLVYLTNAQTPCSGILSGTYNNIIVNSGKCILQNATVHGVVSVNNGAELILNRGTQVYGGIEADGGGKIDIPNGYVLGSINLKNSLDLTIGNQSTVNSIFFENSNDLIGYGRISDIKTVSSGSIFLEQATVFPGYINMDQATGDLSILGSTVEGVVLISSSHGNITVTNSQNSNVVLNNALLINNGSGDINVENATMASSDIIISERTGEVYLNNLNVSDVNISKHQDNVQIESLTIDSDFNFIENDGELSISNSYVQGDVHVSKNNMDINISELILDGDIELGENQGTIILNRSHFHGDAALFDNQRVQLDRNNFALEDVIIAGNSGPVSITNNSDLNLSIIENNDVYIENNQVLNLEITKNTGSTFILYNSGNIITCSDNSPNPVCSRNIFTLDQCSDCVSQNRLGSYNSTINLPDNDFKLFINTPNAFTYQTTIGFYIPNKTDAKLEVYDTYGRKLEQLASGNFDEGFHRMNWDTNKYSNGLYILKFESDNYIESLKMILEN